MNTTRSLLQHPVLQTTGKFQNLVENRHAFSFCHSELSLYETRQQAEQVQLYFEHPVLAIMLQGRKQMHLPDGDFPFLPGESVIMQGNSTMVIDFPEATLEKPTGCLALEISADLITKTLDLLNERAPKADETQIWRLEKTAYHFSDSVEIYGAAHRLFDLYSRQTEFTGQLEYLTLQELVLRILQTQARGLLLEESGGLNPHTRLAAAIAYINNHIHHELDIDTLSSIACMSKPHFFRCFKAEMGMPPVVYIHRQKIRHACKELVKPGRNISDVGYALGFSNLGYFSRVFKKLTGLSPAAYKAGKAGIVPA